MLNFDGGPALISDVLFWRESDEITAGQVMICCPQCEYSLTLHQPDPKLPERLLATCDECKAWFLSNSDGVNLVAIPPRREHGKHEGLVG